MNVLLLNAGSSSPSCCCLSSCLPSTLFPRLSGGDLCSPHAYYSGVASRPTHDNGNDPACDRAPSFSHLAQLTCLLLHNRRHVNFLNDCIIVGRLQSSDRFELASQVDEMSDISLQNPEPTPARSRSFSASARRPILIFICIAWCSTALPEPRRRGGLPRGGGSHSGRAGSSTRQDHHAYHAHIDAPGGSHRRTRGELPRRNGYQWRLRSLQAASCTYRIALGPRAGQKVLSLQSLPSRTMPS